MPPIERDRAHLSVRESADRAPCNSAIVDMRSLLLFKSVGDKAPEGYVCVTIGDTTPLHALLCGDEL